MSSISPETWQHRNSFETSDSTKTKKVMEYYRQGHLDIYPESKIKDQSSRGSGPTSEGRKVPGQSFSQQLLKISDSFRTEQPDFSPSHLPGFKMIFLVCRQAHSLSVPSDKHTLSKQGAWRASRAPCGPAPHPANLLLEVGIHCIDGRGTQVREISLYLQVFPQLNFRIITFWIWLAHDHTMNPWENQMRTQVF